jgi:hypothetical protein
LSEEAGDAAIVKAIIQLGHTMQLEVVAEGVETADQLVFLKDSGCDQAQGSLFSMPVSAGDVPRLFTAFGKHELHAFLLQTGRSTSKSVPNSSTEIQQLQTWLKNRKAQQVHACLEATGGWSEDVAIALSESDHVVSLVNPARIKAFAKSKMLRTKTDKVHHVRLRHSLMRDDSPS